MVTFDDPEAEPSRAVCLDKHDLVVSKLAAGREKDRSFADALIAAGLVDVEVLKERVDLLPVPVAVKKRIVATISAVTR